MSICVCYPFARCLYVLSGALVSRVRPDLFSSPFPLSLSRLRPHTHTHTLVAPSCLSLLARSPARSLCLPLPLPDTAPSLSVFRRARAPLPYGLSPGSVTYATLACFSPAPPQLVFRSCNICLPLVSVVRRSLVYVYTSSFFCRSPTPTPTYIQPLNPRYARRTIQLLGPHLPYYSPTRVADPSPDPIPLPRPYRSPSAAPSPPPCPALGPRPLYRMTTTAPDGTRAR